MTSEPTRKHLILFLAANPISTAQLALGKECAGIERELRDGPERDAFDFRSSWAVDPAETMRQLNALRPAVIHFSGHGGPGSSLRLSPSITREVAPAASSSVEMHDEHDEHDESHEVNARAFARMIQTAAPCARIVVLNACYSDAMADALVDVVDCVIGMRGPIDDEAARVFSAGFYRALAHGKSVGNAFSQAVAGLMVIQGSGDWTPVCRTRTGIDANDIVLARPAAPPPPPAPPESFPAARRLVGLLGVPGKTQSRDELFASSLAHYNITVRAARDFKDLGHEQLIHWIGDHVFEAFVADDDWRRKLSRYSPDSELYVSIVLHGHFGDEKCKLELGLWWREDRQPVVYAGLHDVAWGRKLEPTRTGTERDVTSTAYLLREVSGTNAAATAQSLLEEFEEAAKRARLR